MPTANEFSPFVNQFTCALCGGTFGNAWSDAEAAAELAESFPGFDTDECDVVCDDCYRRLTLAGGGSGSWDEIG